MRSLFDYILEYKGHAAHNGAKSVGDPDEIQCYFRQGWVKLDFKCSCAYPYIYNKANNKIVFGKPGNTHPMILMDKKKLEDVGISEVTSIQQLRYCCGLDSEFDKIDAWYKENKTWIDKIVCGRIWYIEKSDINKWAPEYQNIIQQFDELDNEDSMMTFVCNWNEIDTSEFSKINNDIIKLFSKEYNKQIKSYIAIDNNGEPIEMELGKNVIVDDRDASHKKKISKLYDLHSDPKRRDEKRKMLAPFRKNRGEEFQKKYWNNTKSGTEAEFHNNKTMKINPVTGKTEWGEKIGDSLKSITDIIAESSKHPVKTEQIIEDINDLVYWRRTNNEQYYRNLQAKLFFDGDIPENLKDKEYPILEFLKSINSSKMINILKDNFSIYNIIDNGDAISFESDIKKLNNDIKFRYLISNFNYRLHSKDGSKYYIEKCFPEEITYKIIKFFHITPKGNEDYLLDKGLRPKYCGNEMNEHFRLKQNKSNYNNFARVYLLGFTTKDINNDLINIKIKEAINKIYKTDDLSKFSIISMRDPGITLYKDPMMDDDYSYYTYDYIPKEFLNKYK